MKKNKMLRAASLLLVLVLLTTSIIGGTFAKYTTTGSVNDTARVAKFGVVITTSGTLYSNAYAKETNVPIAWSATPDKDSITVAAATENDNIVAPGTKSYANGMSFGVSGKPEVAVNVAATIKAEDIFLAAGTYGVLVPATVSDNESLKKVVTVNTNGVYALKDNKYTKLDATATYDATGTTYYILTNKVELTGADYYPVKYTLTGTTQDTDKTAVEIATQLATTIKTGVTDENNAAHVAAYTNVSTEYPANTDLAANGPKLGNENLKWAWAFNGNDAADTFLGDLIAARGTTPAHKFVSITTTAGVETVTVLNISNADNDYTVKNGDTVVANLRTLFDISLTVTQID